MVVAVDAKKVSEKKWEIFTHGGRKKTGIDAIEFAKKAEINGAGEILLTSMDKDGTKSGYDLELLNLITKSVNVPVIASGGAGTLDHLYDAIKTGGASAVLAASIFIMVNLLLKIQRIFKIKEYSSKVIACKNLEDLIKQSGIEKFISGQILYKKTLK